MNYINVQWHDGSIETVDEFNSRREAVTNAHEYRMAYGIAARRIWVSSRSTKAWRERIEI